MFVYRPKGTKNVQGKMDFEKSLLLLSPLCSVKRSIDEERWVSGLNQQFAKLSYGITVPGVRIPLFPLS